MTHAVLWFGTVVSKRVFESDSCLKLISKGIGLTSKVSRSYCLPLGAHLHRWSVCRVFWGDKVRLSSGIATNNVAIWFNTINSNSILFTSIFRSLQGRAIVTARFCMFWSDCITLKFLFLPNSFECFRQTLPTVSLLTHCNLETVVSVQHQSNILYCIMYITIYLIIYIITKYYKYKSLYITSYIVTKYDYNGKIY